MRSHSDHAAFGRAWSDSSDRAAFDREFGGAIAGFGIYQDVVGAADVVTEFN